MNYLFIILLFLLFLFLQSHNEPFKNSNTNFYNKKLKDTQNVNNILLSGTISEEQVKYFFDTFKEAKIYILNEDKTTTYKIEEKSDIKRIKIVTEYPYDNNIISLFQKSNVLFDIIICSDINTIENMIYVIKSYPILLTNKSIIIIEDIQSYVDASKIIDNFPENLKNEIFIYDNRRTKVDSNDIKIYYENYF
jgi:hypothetical protein